MTETEYPWQGRVRLTVERTPARAWALSPRLPGWSLGADVRVNGSPVDPPVPADGYLNLKRVWQRGDTVELDLHLEPRLVEPHPWIEPTRGCLAIERGPLVYCLEQRDHPQARLYDLELDMGGRLTSCWQGDLLGGVELVRAGGFEVDSTAWEHQLYRPMGTGPAPSLRPAELTAIPYYAWANRGPGAMRVWLPVASARRASP
jgi:hypothetical protein